MQADEEASTRPSAPPTATRAGRVRAASAERRDRARRDLRARILAAAEALFDTGGAEAVTMRGVAEQIGYSATTIYHHFPDRDALLFAIVDDAFEGFAADMGEAIRSAPDAASRVGAMGRAYVRFALDHPAHYRLMFIQRPDYLMRHGPAEERARIESLGVLASVVADSRAGRAGVVEPSAGADAVWAAVHGIAALATGVQIFDRPRAEAAAEAAITLLVGGLDG